jgi:hypothetical protein
MCLYLYSARLSLDVSDLFSLSTCTVNLTISLCLNIIPNFRVMRYLRPEFFVYNGPILLAGLLSWSQKRNFQLYLTQNFDFLKAFDSTATLRWIRAFFCSTYLGAVTFAEPSPFRWPWRPSRHLSRPVEEFFNHSTDRWVTVRARHSPVKMTAVGTANSPRPKRV